MVTYNFQKLLYRKRDFPRVQFLLLITFKSGSLAPIWPKSLSRGWPLYALRNQLCGNAESLMSLTWTKGPMVPATHGAHITAAEYAPVLHN